MSASELLSWREVDVWSFIDRNDAERLVRGGPEHVAALREYRNRGSIRDCYLADPAEYSADDAGELCDLCDAGPASEQIDWTGIDEACA